MSAFGFKVEILSSRIPQYDAREVDLLVPIVHDLAQQLGRRPRLLQIGANDGIKGDPVRPLIEDDVIEAILVEPMPEPFKKLTALHGRNPMIRLENVAVAVGGSDLKLYSFQDQTGAARFESRTSPSLKSVKRVMKQIQANPDLENTENLKIIETTVPTKSIDALLKSNGWDEADVLVIDTEGLDRQIVLNTIKDGHYFKVLHFEAIFVTRGQYPELLKSLAGAGYGTARTGRDILAIHSTHPRSSSTGH